MYALQTANKTVPQEQCTADLHRQTQKVVMQRQVEKTGTIIHTTGTAVQTMAEAAILHTTAATALHQTVQATTAWDHKGVQDHQ